MSAKRRLPWWRAAVSIAACVALLVGMATALPLLRPKGQTPLVDGGETTTTDTQPTDRPQDPHYPQVVMPVALAKPQYPTMNKRPVSYDADPDEFDAWREQVVAQRQQVKGQTEGMTDYYAATMAQFLAGEAGENRVYSPLNVYLALAMLAESAEGDSRQQILDLLGVSDLTALREKCSALWNGVYMNDGGVTSLLANSLWLSDSGNWQYDMDTVEALAAHYYTSTFEGEMGSKEYDQALQNWINEQTDNLLKEQAEGLAFDPNTVLALASTICFKARWYDEFNPQHNTDGYFKMIKGDLPVTFMHQSHMGSGYFGEQFTAISLGLDDGAYRMFFFLPDEGVSVDSLVTDQQVLEVMQEDTFSELFHHLRINMTIPQFDVVSDKDLVDGLKALGVTDVFDKGKGDFGGILAEQTDPMWVDKVQHAARVAIDEEGVTAAAYTVEILNGTGAPLETLDFVADRPFMFAITGPGNTILFAGVVENP